MPRPLVLGNGAFLVTLDSDLFMRDFTFPYVGLLNHLSGHKVRLGVWKDGHFAWLDAPEWRKSLRYEPDTLVTHCECVHDGLGVTLLLSDCVAHDADILLRRVDVTPHPSPRDQGNSPPCDIRLFQSHDFHLAETDIGDTAFYLPSVDGLVHYKRDIYILAGGKGGNSADEQNAQEGQGKSGLYQYTTGIKGFGGAEGTWRDAEDGELGLNPVEQGSVDSTFSVRGMALPGQTITFQAWLCVAHTLDAVQELHTRIQETGFEAIRAESRKLWAEWSRPAAELPEADRLPAPVADAFRRSLLIMRTQIDNRGAILAANDSDILQTARAHYSYMWPRDGALVASSLDALGYADITRRFFEFCGRVARPTESGGAVLMHKYGPDETWGATWHPWIVDGKPSVPFQQDSTALVLWALARHYERHGDLDFLEGLYASFVVPAGNFLIAHRDPDTGLPASSYDLWEERRGIHAFTCGTTVGALDACARLARVFNDAPRASAHDDAARQMQDGIHAHLWNQDAGRYARRLIVHANGRLEPDLTIDSAVYGLWAFGAVAPDDPRMAATMRVTHDRLRVQTDIGGQARYEDDYYFRRSDDIGRVPGNPWIICTLWRAQYQIATARTASDLEPALELLSWAVRRAAQSGVLPEQLNPFTGEPLSVSPLTWSHAEFVATVLQYLDKVQFLDNV